MDSTMILSARFGLLALLWVFIFLVMWTQRKDVVSAGGAVRRQASASAPAPREKARTLAVVEGPLQGSHMEIASLEDLTVGRAGDNDFQLGDDSPPHATRACSAGAATGLWRIWIRATAPSSTGCALISLSG